MEQSFVVDAALSVAVSTMCSAAHNFVDYNAEVARGFALTAAAAAVAFVESMNYR